MEEGKKNWVSVGWPVGVDFPVQVRLVRDQLRRFPELVVVNQSGNFRCD